MGRAAKSAGAAVQTYGRLVLAANSWVMSELEPHVAIRMKHVFPRVSKTATTDFRFPNDDVHCSDLCWFMQRYPLRMSDVDRLAIQAGRHDFEDAQGDSEAILRPHSRPPASTGSPPP